MRTYNVYIYYEHNRYIELVFLRFTNSIKMWFWFEYRMSLVIVVIITVYLMYSLFDFFIKISVLFIWSNRNKINLEKNVFFLLQYVIILLHCVIVFHFCRTRLAPIVTPNTSVYLSVYWTSLLFGVLLKCYQTWTSGCAYICLAIIVQWKQKHEFRNFN